MYFLDLAALKDELSLRDLSTSESLKYFIGYSLMWAPSVIRLFRAEMKGMILSLLLYFIAISGIVYCYRKNGGSSGRDFLSRFISLSWVVGLRLLIVAGMIGLGLTLASLVLESFPAVGSSATFDAILSIMLITVFYYLLGTHMQQVAIRSDTA